MQIKYLEAKREDGWGGWWRRVEVDGVVYHVGVTRGNRVRLAYSSKFGWQWWGNVNKDGKSLWHGRVTKTRGVRGLLKDAGVL